MAIPQIPHIPAADLEPQLDSPEMAAHDYFAGLSDPVYPQEVDSGVVMPPAEWQLNPNGYQGHDVPVVDDGQGLGMQHNAPPAYTAPVGHDYYAGLGGGYEGHDVPVVENDQALAQQHQAVNKPGQDYPHGKPAAPAQAAQAPQQDTYLTDMDRYAKERADQAQKEADAQKAQNDYLANETARVNAEQQTKLNEIENARVDAQKQARDKSNQLAQEAQDIANQKLDRGRFFRNEALPGTIAFGVAAALQGALNPGGRNQVVDLIEKNIDRDLDMQRADIENRRAGLATRQNLLSQEIAMGRDDIDARYKAMMTGFEFAKNQIAAEALKYNDQLFDIRAQKTITDINERQTILTKQYQQGQEALKFDQWRTKQQIAQGWASQNRADRELQYQKQHDLDELEYKYTALGMSKDAAKAQAQAEYAKQQKEQAEKDRGKLIMTGKKKDGADLLAPTEEVAKDMNKKMGAAQTFTQKMDRLNQIYERHGWELTNLGDDEREAKGLLVDIKADYSRAKEQGVIRPGEYELYDKMFGADPSSILDMRPVWNARRREIIMDINNDLKNRVDKDSAWWEPEPLDPTTDEEKQRQRNLDKLSIPQDPETRAEMARKYPHVVGGTVYAPEPSDDTPPPPKTPDAKAPTDEYGRPKQANPTQQMGMREVPTKPGTYVYAYGGRAINIDDLAEGQEIQLSNGATWRKNGSTSDGSMPLFFTIH